MQYQSPCVLIAGVKDDEPDFVYLEEIFVIMEDVYIKACSMLISSYSMHFHAYVLSLSTPKVNRLLKIDDLYNPFPLHPRVIHGLTSPGQFAVVLKYAFCIV